jgi:peptidoglycan/xylan/chitin deacetylase (PgdA/CDA1 family)
VKHYVSLTFDFDAFSSWIGTYKSTNASSLSRGEFGVEGMRRVLRLLDKHGLRTTFFVPGHTALAFPDSVRAAIGAGHEIGHHGFVHERITELTPEREHEVLKIGIDILSDLTGRRPIGYRSPSWEFTSHTIDYLLEEGFRYDSSLMASDYVPYWPRRGDSFTSDGPYVFGKPAEIVEMPVSWELDDMPHFSFVRGVNTGLKAPTQVREIWFEEFRYFCEEVAGGCWTLTMHPQIIGRGHRIRMLDELIAEMKQWDVVFAPLAEAADTWRSEQSAVPLPLDRDPASIHASR